MTAIGAEAVRASSSVRPAAVGLALVCLWSGLALGILLSLLVSFRPADVRSWAACVGELLGLALIGAPWAWVIVNVARGRRWARMVTIGCAAAGGGIWLASAMSGAAGRVDFALVMSGAQQALGVAAALLLSTPGSRAWFRRRRAA